MLRKALPRVLTLVLTFSSVSLSAQTFNGVGGLPVPPGAPAVTVGITTSDAIVSGIGILGNGCTHIDNVTLNFQHTFVGDVAIFLIAPSGQVLELSSSNGGAGDNYIVTVFTDFAAQFITSGAPPYNGSFRPEGRQQSTTPPFPNTNPLGTFTFQNTFDGVNADGTWTLFINDYVAIDVGVLNSWSITFSAGGGPAPVVTLGPDITICPGEMTTLTAAVVPGATAYAWNTGATSQSINVSPAITTQYIVTVTNNGCVDFDTVNVNIDPTGVIANAGMDISICSGNSADLHATGGGPGATFAWSNGGSGPDITVAPGTSTTYTVTVTDGACSGTDQVTVTVTPMPNANAGNDVMLCEGQSINLTGSGGTNNNQYSWSTGQIGQIISVNPVTTTTYTLTVNINGCMDDDEVTVTVNPTPFVDGGPDEEICVGESVDLSASGSAGTYTWSTGQMGTNITVSPVTSTNYIISVTANGCVGTDVVFVDVNEVFANAGPDETICDGESVTLTATGGTQFDWSNGSTSQSITVSPTAFTIYTVTVSDGTCEDVADVSVTVNPVPVAGVSPNQTICAGESVMLTATGGTNYAWSNGFTGAQITVSPVIPTTYVVSVTANGCSSTASVDIDVNPSPDITAGSDQSICEGESASLLAEVVSGGGAFAWSTGAMTAGISVTPATTTIYSVTVTNADGCTDTDDVQVTVNAYPNADAGPDVSFCEGDVAELNASGGTGPSSYAWSSGQSGASIQVSPSIDEIYTVTVTVAGCSSTDDVLVTVLPAPVADAGADETVCEGNSSVVLVATGGGSYAWSTGQSGSSITVIPNTTTTYFVTVTNIDGCEDVDEITVFIDPAPAADAGPDVTICAGETAELTATGGGTYQWSTSSTNATINVSPNFTTAYTITVTSANGCTDVDAVTVTVNDIPPANAGPNTFILPGESATLTATGGGTYAWSTGETTASITVMPDTTTIYSVTVTLNGCTAIDQVTVFVNQLPAVDLGQDASICAGESIVLDATILGPFTLTYLWNTDDTTETITVSPGMDTIYSVTVTDVSTGFSTTDTIEVTVMQIPLGNVTITGDSVFCEGSVLNYSANAVQNAEVYTWSVPAGAIILSGQGTTFVQVDWGSVSAGQLSLVVSNTCGSLPAEIEEIEVETVPVVLGNITGDLSPCNWISTAYQIGNVTGADSYTWTVTGGALIAGGQGTSSVTIDWNSTSGGDICVTANNACGMATPVCLTVNTTSSPVANAGQDTSVCGQEITLGALGAGTWTIDSGPGNPVLDNATDPSTLFSSDVPGSYQLTWTVDNNGCVASAQIQVDLLDTPELNTIDEICNDAFTDYQVSFSISGGTGPYSVNGNAIGGTTYTSSDISAGTAYQFVVTDFNGCEAPELTGVQDCSCITATGTMDQNVVRGCIDDIITAQYNGDAELDIDDTLLFVLHDGTFPDGIIQWNDTPEFAFSAGMTAGQTYYVSVVVGNASGTSIDLTDPCLDASAGTPVIFYAPPVADAGVDLIRGCDNNQLQLSGSNSSAPAAYQWSAFNGGTIVGASNVVDIATSSAGGYILTVTDLVSGCTDIDTVVVVQHTLALGTLMVESTDPSCIDDCSGIIELDGEPDWLYSIDGVTYLPLSTYGQLCAGDYAIYVKDTFNCVQDSVIHLEDQVPVTVELGPDTTINKGARIELIAQIAGTVSTTVWEPTNCPGCTSRFVQPSQTTTYSILVTDNNGCTAYDEITVFVIPSKNIFIPTAFSPNGDNVNDKLIIQANPSVVYINHFEIYDRWGTVVYSLHDASPSNTLKAWDGTFKGKPLDPGVFVYHLVATITGDTQVDERGDITLIR